MQKRRLACSSLFFACVLCVASCTTAQVTAPTRIAVVNLRLVYSNMQETIDTDNDIARKKDQLAALIKSNDPDSDGESLKIKIARTQNRQMKQAYDKIRSAVTELSIQKNIDLVLVSTGTDIPPNTGDIADTKTVANLVFNHTILYASDQIDLTADVISLLNKSYHSPPGIAAYPQLQIAPMQIGSKTFQLEIAANDPDREHGLMERDTLPIDHGMIFVFPVANELNFWMHHTRFALDIIYADEQGKIVSIKTMKPYDESNVSSDGAAKYAIELPASQASASGVKPNDRLVIPATVDAAMKNK